MKKIIAFIAFLLTLTLSVPVLAGNVTYTGNAGKIVFSQGSDNSLTDLFLSFNDVMPGDEITETVTVKNDASDKVKVKIYMRSLGSDEMSREFLSKLNLKVKKSDENTMAYMFDAAPSEKAQLTEWVYLGTLYSGGEVNLDVTLAVPTSLESKYQDKLGTFKWEFMVEELAAESTDPVRPGGDSTSYGMWIAVIAATVTVFIIVIIKKKKDNTSE